MVALFARLPLMQGNLCTTISCRPAKSACNATASRLQPIQQLETIRQLDTFTPTGYGSPGLYIYR